MCLCDHEIQQRRGNWSLIMYLSICGGRDETLLPIKRQRLFRLWRHCNQIHRSSSSEATSQTLGNQPPSPLCVTSTPLPHLAPTPFTPRPEIVHYISSGIIKSPLYAFTHTKILASAVTPPGKTQCVTLMRLLAAASFLRMNPLAFICHTYSQREIGH